MRSRLSAREYLTSSVRRLDRRFNERAATGFARASGSPANAGEAGTAKPFPTSKFVLLGVFSEHFKNAKRCDLTG